MSAGVIIGFVLIVVLMIGVGYYSGRSVRNAEDFITSGGKANSFMVLGAILGSLVGSQATIGTAQLAFNYGISACWFTLGAGIGCVFLGVLYAKRLRQSGCVTEMQIISKEYGPVTGSVGSVLGSLGIFFSVLAQTAACLSLTKTFFPGIPTAAALVIGVVLMTFWVIFGGNQGAGLGGFLKMILLCLTAFIAFVFIENKTGGLDSLIKSIYALFTGTPLGDVQSSTGLSRITDYSDLSSRFLSVVARGPMKDIGSGLSLLLGVLCTQTYAQAIWSAKSDKAARRGALMCAVATPFIGACCICIGLFMRSNYLLQSEVNALAAAGQNIPDMPVLSGTIQVFPTFVLSYMPPIVSGMMLGTMLINVVASGAGLSLGMATILTKDIYKKITKKPDDPGRELRAVRIMIVFILAATAGITLLVSNTAINDLGFLSMGLRGTVVFLPLTFALWMPGKTDRRFILASMIAAPLGVIAAQIAGTKIDSLFVGMFISLAICLMGWLHKNMTERR